MRKEIKETEERKRKRKEKAKKVNEEKYKEELIPDRDR